MTAATQRVIGARTDAAVYDYLHRGAVLGLVAVSIRDIAAACDLSLGGTHGCLTRLIRTGRIEVVELGDCRDRRSVYRVVAPCPRRP